MLNLYDLTHGSYRVFRVVSYPDYPADQILFDVDVEARGSEWATTVYLNGAYTGPTDVVANSDYQISWMVLDGKLFESGRAELELSSGERLLQNWSSIITPIADSDRPAEAFAKFPPEGELINVSFSRFELEGMIMGYNWEGAVTKRDRKRY